VVVVVLGLDLVLVRSVGQTLGYLELVEMVVILDVILIRQVVLLPDRLTHDLCEFGIRQFGSTRGDDLQLHALDLGVVGDDHEDGVVHGRVQEVTLGAVVFPTELIVGVQPVPLYVRGLPVVDGHVYEDDEHDEPGGQVRDRAADPVLPVELLYIDLEEHQKPDDAAHQYEPQCHRDLPGVAHDPEDEEGYETANGAVGHGDEGDLGGPGLLLQEGLVVELRKLDLHVLFLFRFLLFPLLCQG